MRIGSFFCPCTGRIKLIQALFRCDSFGPKNLPGLTESGKLLKQLCRGRLARRHWRGSLKCSGFKELMQKQVKNIVQRSLKRLTAARACFKPKWHKLFQENENNMPIHENSKRSDQVLGLTTTNNDLRTQQKSLQMTSALWC